MILRKIMEKHYTTLIPLSIIIFGITCIIGYLINKDVFRITAIDHKYCYHIMNDCITEVYATENIEKAYQVISYYYCDFYQRKGIMKGKGMYSMGEDIKKVEVLEYTDDFLLAKIRYKYYSPLRGGMVIESKVYVPTFSLHDTIPHGYEVINSDL